MSRTITDQQWAAGRAMNEGMPATHARIAACLGVHTSTVSHRAAEEGWESLDFRHARLRQMQARIVETSRRIRTGEDLDPVDPALLEEAHDEAALEALEPWPDEPASERIARIGTVLNGQMEKILRRVEAGMPPESRQVAALGNLVTLGERIAAMAREEDNSQKHEYTDAEIAEAIALINRRIVELATYNAREMAVRKLGLSPEKAEELLPDPVLQEPDKQLIEARA